ncbi:transcriptional regulator, GntR family [Arboricoccus pini]|uniref:Transcriptional regulator, GntR family n=1 Tax=Arboricoccus pini TaxID=1963835 RepID=A0A212RYT5_9PROT|nr:GntR family transcriptional regulator [Arboricoccus pini]SNB77880.1 transcriptional regulator, GntR family [Arboricoccus pini]
MEQAAAVAEKDRRTVVERLYETLSGWLLDGRFAPGQQLPTELRLAQTFKVSRPALREALKLLEQDGLIRSERGKGRFVAPMASLKVERPITCFESVTQMVARFGYQPRSHVLSVAEIVPEPSVAKALRLEPDARVIRLERLRLHQKRVIVYCVDHVRRDAVPARIYDVDWRGSLLELLRGFGRAPVMSSAAAAAVMLPDEVASRYELADFGPAFLISETCFDAQGLPVLFAADYHRGDSFTFNFART